MTCFQKKCELRERLLSIAKTLDNDNGDIARKVLTIPEWHNADTIFCYVSYRYEPNTLPIFKAAFAQGKSVCVPFCLDSGIMKAIEITSLDDLYSGSFGILEPSETGAEVLPHEIDLVIVPCLGADIDCNRIGKGKGYYDRFLSNCRDNCYKLLLCRKELIVQDLPLESHDLKADVLVTNQQKFFILLNALNQEAL